MKKEVYIKMDHNEKELNKIIDKTADELNKLGTTLDKLNMLDSDDKKHAVLKSFYQHHAINEIKKILHDANKYEKYDEKEFEKYLKSIKEDYPEYIELEVDYFE